MKSVTCNRLKRYSVIKVIALLMILCTCWFACSKSSAPSFAFTLSKDALAYVQLSQGKYFIYKDSATLLSDSVVVTQSSFQTISGTPPISKTVETYMLMLSKIDPAGNNTAWLSGKAQAVDTSGDTYMERIVPGNNGYLFRYPPCNCGSASTIETTIPSMVVEGKTYTNVVLSASLQNDPYAYYWAGGVGLIKCTETIDSVSKTYTLLRHN